MGSIARSLRLHGGLPPGTARTLNNTLQSQFKVDVIDADDVTGGGTTQVVGFNANDFTNRGINFKALLNFAAFDDIDYVNFASNAVLADQKDVLSATYTWDGTTTVLSADTSEVEVGDMIQLDSDGQLFEIATINEDVSVVILNPSILVIPSGATASSSTTGRIVDNQSPELLVRTNVAGEFRCKVTNLVDEDVFFSCKGGDYGMRDWDCSDFDSVTFSA